MAFEDMLVYRANVYTVPADADDLTLVRTALPMRRDFGSGVDGAGQRVRLTDQATLIWGPEYRIPDYAQVEIEAERWNVVAGTVTGIPGGFTSAVHHYECQAIKVVT